MSARFEDQTVIVTGAGRGIGAATARRFASEGARVVLVARTRSELEEQAGEVGPEQSLVVVADISRIEDVERVFDATRERWGLADHLVNNAGALGQAPLADLDADTWDRVFAVNARGPFLLTRAFLRNRPAELGGSIVNVTSISGVPGPAKFPGFAAYAASKAALMLFTEVAAAEARPLGVRVNAVAPGSTDTVMFRTAAPGVTPDLQPDDVARVILFACSDDAKGVTGQSLNVWG